MFSKTCFAKHLLWLYNLFALIPAYAGLIKNIAFALPILNQISLMKTFLLKILKLVSVVLLLAGSNQTIAQVTNGTYNIEVHYLQGWGVFGTDDIFSGAGEQTHNAKVVLNNTNNPAVALFNTTSGAANTPKVCYMDNTDEVRWGPLVDWNIATLTGSTNGRFDYGFFTWEDDAGGTCTYDSGDEGGAQSWGNLYV